MQLNGMQAIKMKINRIEEDGTVTVYEQALDSIFEVQADIEMKIAIDCYHSEKAASEDNREFKCTCFDPFKLSVDETLKYWMKMRKGTYNES